MHFMLACTQAHAKVQSNTFKIFLVCAYEPPKSNTREVHLQTKNNYKEHNTNVLSMENGMYGWQGLDIFNTAVIVFWDLLWNNTPDSGASHAPQPLTCCERCPSLWLPPCSQSCVSHLVDPFLPNTMTFPLPRFPFLPFHPPPSLLHRTVLCYFIASQGFPADFCWKCKSKEKRGKKEKEKKVKKKRHAAISTPPPLRVPAVYSEVCGWVAGKRDVRSNKEKKHLPFYASMARFMR